MLYVMTPESLKMNAFAAILLLSSFVGFYLGVPNGGSTSNGPVESSRLRSGGRFV
jgi:hypothetical protein